MEVRARFPSPSSQPVFTEPLLADSGKLVLVGTDAGELLAIFAGSAGEAWRRQVATGQIKGSPAEYRGWAFVGTHDGTVVVVESQTGKEVWRYQADGIFGLSRPIIVDNRLYVGNDNGRIYAFDLP
jgi:outer membrane protein assembly factor BamB